MARKGEQAWHSYEQDKPIHILRNNLVNYVSALSLLRMEPMSWLPSVQIERQENVSKHDIHANKTHQSTYRATVDSMT